MCSIRHACRLHGGSVGRLGVAYATRKTPSYDTIPTDNIALSVNLPIPERIIMKRSIISILVAGLCVGAATAVLAAEEPVTTNPKPAESPTSRGSEANEQSMHDKGAADFKKADKDNDGTLDRKEAKSMPRVAKHFAAIDTDHDGTVSLDEVHTYMAAHPRKKGEM